MATDSASLCTLTSFDQGRSLRLPSIRISVTAPDRSVLGATLEIRPLVLGTSPECDVVIADPRISRRHCELRITERGVVLRDLGSKNGTLIRGVPIIEVLLPSSVPVTIGSSELVILPTGAPSVLPLSAGTSFGEAIGHSLTMRALFAKLERAAPTEETILLLGESGTGKEVLAKAIHDNSRRREGPFIVVDCGAIAPNLVEGELFGHMRGAFTGAVGSQPGLLEQASGGTLFIDELGELPLELQPKLLRALESRQIRRLGASDYRPFDARVIAATHRNLRARIAEGTLREDLYYRIAVVEVHVPALRERKDDIPPLVERFLAARDPPCSLADLPPTTLSLLQAHDWPGNVRELRNTVARVVLFPELIPELIGAKPLSPGLAAAASVGDLPRGAVRSDVSSRASSLKKGDDVDADRLGRLLDLQLPQAREVVMEQFERTYLSTKLRQHAWNISRAADAMGVSRQLVHRLVDRYGLRGKPRAPGQGDDD
jgi:transcriptional regulator with PAS, ATPase and Fis domain